MKNDFFDFGRYWMYQKHVVYEMGILLILLFGILAVGCAIGAMTGIWQFPGLCAIVAVLMSCTMGRLAMFCTKNKCLFEMVTPASVFEKYLSRLLAFGIFPCVLMCFVGMMFDIEQFCPIPMLIAIFSVYWLLCLVLSRFTALLWGGFVFAFNGMHSLAELLGDYMQLYVAVVAVLSIAVAYVIFKRKNVTLKNWTNGFQQR